MKNIIKSILMITMISQMSFLSISAFAAEAKIETKVESNNKLKTTHNKIQAQDDSKKKMLT